MIKKSILIFIVIIWFCSLSLLIVALTDMVPDNPLLKYRFIMGIGFMTITSFLKWIYIKLIKA